jgi:hypothetical protein
MYTFKFLLREIVRILPATTIVLNHISGFADLPMTTSLGNTGFRLDGSGFGC